MTRKDIPKAEQALRLWERKIDVPTIAERLGVGVRAVYQMIHRARKLREKAAEVVSE